MLMLKLTTEDTFVIEGRGTVHTLHMPLGYNPRELTGQDVILDGRQVTVRGVETWARPDGPWLLDGPPCGLLV